MAGRLSSGPGFGHLWSGAREAGWAMIQHLLFPFSSGNRGSHQAPRRRGQSAECRRALLAAGPVAPAELGGWSSSAGFPAEGRRGRRSGHSRLRDAEAGRQRARAGGAAGEGTRSGAGHCSLAGSQGPRARCGRGAGGGVRVCLPAGRSCCGRAGPAGGGRKGGERCSPASV